jgi:hypothetical protein
MAQPAIGSGSGRSGPPRGGKLADNLAAAVDQAQTPASLGLLQNSQSDTTVVVLNWPRLLKKK